VLSPELGAGARSVESEPGFLSKGWLRFEALFGCACVPAVGCGERPFLEGLQEVTEWQRRARLPASHASSPMQVRPRPPRSGWAWGTPVAGMTRS